MEKKLPPIFVDRLFRYITIFVLFISLLNKLQGLTILALAILFFIYGAKLWSKAGKNKIVLDFGMVSQRLFPREEIILSVTVENRKILPVWLQIKFNTSVGGFTEFNNIRESSLLWYQKGKWELRAKAVKRGWYLLDSPRLLIGDPFGFFQERKKINKKPVEFIVYPEIFPIEIPPLLRRMFLGNVTDRYGLVKDPVFLSGTRKYQYGQPAKYINWKASARHQNLEEKTFESSLKLKVLFVINVEDFINKPEYFEKMIKVIASLAVRFDESGFSYGLITNGHLAGKSEKFYGFLPVTESKDHLLLFFELLARLQQEKTYSIQELLEKELFSPGITALYFSYYNDKRLSPITEILRGKGIPLLNIFCAEEGIKGEISDSFQLEELFAGKINSGLWYQKEEGK